MYADSRRGRPNAPRRVRRALPRRGRRLAGPRVSPSARRHPNWRSSAFSLTRCSALAVDRPPCPSPNPSRSKHVRAAPDRSSHAPPAARWTADLRAGPQGRRREADPACEGFDEVAKATGRKASTVAVTYYRIARKKAGRSGGGVVARLAQSPAMGGVPGAGLWRRGRRARCRACRRPSRSCRTSSRSRSGRSCGCAARSGWLRGSGRRSGSSSQASRHYIPSGAQRPKASERSAFSR